MRGGCLQRIRYRNETFSLRPSRVTVSYGRTTGDSDFSLGFEKWREVKMGVEMVRNGWLGDYIIVYGLNGFFFLVGRV